MRKTVLVGLAIMLCLALPLGALAEGQSFDGQVVCINPVAVKAPFGGIVEDFSLREGRTIEKGEALFSIETTKIYAPVDGMVTGLRAKAGDDAATIQEIYGALCAIEYEGRFTVSATTSGAYSDEENRIVFAGETVYLQNPNSTSRRGVGLITSVDGSSYTIEVTDAGTLHFKDEVNVYRESGHNSSSRIGRGKVARMPAYNVNATGSVLRVAVTEGQKIARGELLFELVDGALDGLKAAGNVVSAEVPGVLAQVNISAGTRVEKGDVLAVLHPTDAPEVKLTIDEEDLALFRVGEQVDVTFDVLADTKVSGVVQSISGTPQETGSAAYSVYVSFPAQAGVQEGMSATVALR